MIQQMRLVHALVECKHKVSIPTEEIPKFQILEDKFGIKFFHETSECMDITDNLGFSHEEPFTSIGEIRNPLIFPHDITNYCASLWADKRKLRYSFQGLMTGERKTLLKHWVENNITGKRTNLPEKEGVELEHIGLGALLLCSSNRGRTFPIKGWDEKYFKILADSEFVLCPSGDFIWTYRFFESILCGAIPIVEKSCHAYEGFRYYSFEDEAKSLAWSQEDADYNFKLCVERITIPGIALNKELARILEKRG